MLEKETKMEKRVNMVMESAKYVIQRNQEIAKESASKNPDAKYILIRKKIVANLKGTIEIELTQMQKNPKLPDKKRIKEVIAEIDNGNIKPVKAYVKDLLSARNPVAYNPRYKVAASKKQNGK